jgi:hypothetical protein
MNLRALVGLGPYPQLNPARRIREMNVRWKQWYRNWISSAVSYVDLGRSRLAREILAISSRDAPGSALMSL